MAATVELVAKIKFLDESQARLNKDAFVRVKKADEKCAALGRITAERKQQHEKALTELRQSTERRLKMVKAGAENKVYQLHMEQRAVREKREIVEAEARGTAAQASSISQRAVDDRMESEHRIAATDLATYETLRSAEMQAIAAHANSEKIVKTVLGRVRQESDRVWALEDLHARSEEISGAKTLRSDGSIHGAPKLKLLPFGPHYRSFEGFGTYGADNSKRFPPIGFKAETAAKIKEQRVQKEWDLADCTS